jgi:hypothetical protein
MDVVIKFLNPKPIDPIFEKDGYLYGYNEDVVLTVFFIFVLFVCDQAVIRQVLHPKGRWFAVHALANALVSYYSFPDVIKTLKDPLNTFRGPTSTMYANSAVSAVHLYHCIFFRLNAADWFHHFTSLPCTLFIAVPFKQACGAMTNFGCFFLCGLPGGLNYVALVLARQGYITTLQQKNFDAVINTWLRGPSMAIYAFLIWQTWLYGNYDLAPFPQVPPWNTGPHAPRSPPF